MFRRTHLEVRTKQIRLALITQEKARVKQRAQMAEQTEANKKKRGRVKILAVGLDKD